MAATSSGQRDRPVKRAKGGTASTRKHRFESFNQRIAKLNIDPIRRVRRHGIEKDDLDSNTSFFNEGLMRWRDLNLSENFAAFINEVEPVCVSLPQILYHHQKIVDTLVKYIEKRDALSLEPLLSLLAHLAHDLGSRFENHFLTTVTLVTSVASKHSDVEVIEWSFTCLTWLFKYLSRLLVPDLRPLFDIMAPLLGREFQKTHITRFAAEAMSFLIRKAALTYSKNKSPLTIIVNHVFEDLRTLGGDGKDVQLYQTGLMTLFSDAIAGVQRGLHSCGPSIYRCLLDMLIEHQDYQTSKCTQVMDGITISMIHCTDAETFKSLLENLTQTIESAAQDADSRRVIMLARLLFVVAAVRKGSRVQDWESLIRSVFILLQRSTEDPISYVFFTPLDKAIAVIFQTAPLDIVLPKFRPVMDILANTQNAQRFLAFCNYFSSLGKERFQSLLAPYFHRYVALFPTPLCLLSPSVG